MAELRECLKKNSAEEKLLFEQIRIWWETLQHNRGDRAQLRRAETPFDVYISRPFQRSLVVRLRAAGIALNNQEAERLALCIGLLAHAKDITADKHFARQLATQDKGSEDVRDIRFRKLMSITDRDDLYMNLLRLMRYMGGKVEPMSLLRGTFYWNETTKKQWAREYYVLPSK